MNTLSLNLALKTAGKANKNKSRHAAANGECFQSHRFYTVPLDREETF